MIVSLDRVCLGCRCSVAAVDTDEVLKRRLQDFGVIPGTMLALRTRDLKRIRVFV